MMAAMTTYSAPMDGAGRSFCIVAARWNDLVVERLVSGALDAFERHGAGDVDVVWVPGSFEIPLAAKQLAASGRYAGIAALGAVIKGATTHDVHVGGQAAAGLMRAQMDTGVPVAFGVLTTDTLEQALERAGSKAGNKGAEAALTLIEMAGLLDQLTS